MNPARREHSDPGTESVPDSEAASSPGTESDPGTSSVSGMVSISGSGTVSGSGTDSVSGTGSDSGTAALRRRLRWRSRRGTLELDLQLRDFWRERGDGLTRSELESLSEILDGDDEEVARALSSGKFSRRAGDGF